MVRFLAVLAVVAMLIAPVQAKDKPGRGRGRGQGNAPVARAFRDGDHGVIVDYYRSQPGGLPPGLAKRGGDLPPGLERQLRRNGTLPPGLRKRFMPFPPPLEARLPPCPPYVRRGLIGGVAVMWNTRTGLILDASMVFGR
jgi:hypothetical protein